MGVHWFDSFAPTDWIALIAAIVSLIAIAVPTALFFLERAERQRAEAATAQAELERDAAEAQRAADELGNARALVELQKKQLDAVERRELESREATTRAQAELVHVWAEGVGNNSRLHLLNTSKMPVSRIIIRVGLTWFDSFEGQVIWDEPVKDFFIHTVSQLGPTGDTPVKLALYETHWQLLGHAAGGPTFGGMDVEHVKFLDTNGLEWVRDSGSDNVLRRVTARDVPVVPAVDLPTDG